MGLFNIFHAYWWIMDAYSMSKMRQMENFITDILRVKGERRSGIRSEQDLTLITRLLSNYWACKHMIDWCQVWPYAFCRRASCNIPW